MNFTHYPLRILIKSDNPYRNQLVTEAHAVNTFGSIPINWNLPECVNCPLVKVIDSNTEVIFPPSTLNDFSFIPINGSMSPVLYSSPCLFLNFYANSSTATIAKGLLSPFQMIDHHVYLVISFLTMVGLAIYLIRLADDEDGVKDENYSAGQLLFHLVKKSLTGQFGLLMFLTCYFSVHSLLHLFSTSFTTKYSISFRDAPIETWSDLNVSPMVECGSIEALYCYRNAARSLNGHNPLYPIGPESASGYIKPRLGRKRVTMFENNIYTRRIVHLYCNDMINVQQDRDLFVHISTTFYYETFFVLLFNSKMDSGRKRWIIDVSYSCVEHGYCLGAYDDALKTVLERHPSDGVTKHAQCDDYVQENDGPDGSYRSISLVNIIDLLQLFTFLIGFVFIIFTIELFLPVKYHNQIIIV